MWFSLFAVVLILAITFYEGLHGLFSSVITCVLTVLAAALAFGLYENVYTSFLIDNQPDHGRAIALLAIFILSLLLLRVIVDALITGNMQFNIYVDRTGGGVFGFITAMIIVGMMAIGFQMLPFERRVLGFQRYTLVDRETGKSLEPTTDREGVTNNPLLKADWSTVRQSRSSLMLNPDGFTVALVSHLSNNSLRGSGEMTFSTAHPDFLDELHRMRAHPFGQNRLTVKQGAVRIEAYWDLGKKPLYAREKTKDLSRIQLKPSKSQPDAGMKRIVVRVSFTSDAADTDAYYRFTTDQICLIPRDPKPGRARQYLPVGMSDPHLPAYLVESARGEPVVTKPESGSLNLDFVFEVPDAADFKPWYVAFKQNARVELTAALDKGDKAPPPLGGPVKQVRPETPTETTPPPPEPPPAQPPAPAPTPTPPPATEAEQPTTDSQATPPTITEHQPDQTQGRVSGVQIANTAPMFSSKLPFSVPLTSYGGNGIDKGNNELKGGHLIAPLDTNWQPIAGKETPLTDLEVPSDQRLLHMFVDKLDPQSWLGGIMGRMVDQIQNIGIVDDRGKEFMPVGVYAIAEVGGQRYFEIRYLDETSRGFAKLPPLVRIKPTNLRGEYSYAFLFHVPKGTRVNEFMTGRKKLDLRQFNLVAP